MFEAYKIGVSLNLINGLSTPLGEIIRQLQTAEAHVKSLQGSLAGLGAAKINTGGVQGLNKELQAAAANVAKVRAEMSRPAAPGGALSGMSQSAPPIPGYNFATSRRTEAAAGGNGYQSGYGLTGTNAYNNYQTGQLAGAVSARYPGANQPTSRDNYGSMFAGGLLAGAGAAVITGPYEEAKKLYQSRANLQTLNLSTSDNDRIYNQAVALSQQIPGSTITGNMEKIQALYGVFGTVDNALKMSKDFTTFATAAEMREGRPIEGLVYNMAKAIEHRGGKVVNNPAEYAKEMNMMSQTYFATDGKVGPSEFFAASQTGKMAYVMMSPEYLTGQFASQIQRKTGMTAGTQAMTAFSSLIGGHMDSKAKGFLADLGGGIYEEGLSASRVNLMRKAMAKAGISKNDPEYTALAPTTGGLNEKYAALFASNPDQFVNNILVPAIQKKYGLEADIPLLLGKYFNRNTGESLAGLYMFKQTNDKDAANFRRSTGFNDALSLYKSSPQGAELAASASFRNFLALFGSVYLPQITKGLTWLAEKLSKISTWSQNNPTIFSYLVKGLAGLAVAGVVSGGILLFGGALGILKGALAGSFIVTGVRAVGGSLVFLGRAVIGGAIATGVRLIGASLIFMRGALAGGMVAAGLTSVAGALGVLSGAVAGFFVMMGSYHIGKYVGSTLAPSTQDKIGLWGTRALAKLGYQPAIDSIIADKAYENRRGNTSNHIAQKGHVPIVIHNQFNVDGKPIEKIVTYHQGKAANAPYKGVNYFDERMDAAIVGMK